MGERHVTGSGGVVARVLALSLLVVSCGSATEGTDGHGDGPPAPGVIPPAGGESPVPEAKGSGTETPNADVADASADASDAAAADAAADAACGSDGGAPSECLLRMRPPSRRFARARHPAETPGETLAVTPAAGSRLHLAFALGTDTVEGVLARRSTHVDGAGQTWEQKPPVVFLTWTEARDRCAALDLDGYGWRLPTRSELVALMRTNGVGEETSDWFWTTTSGARASAAWAISIGGMANSNDRTTRARARCVR